MNGFAKMNGSTRMNGSTIEIIESLPSECQYRCIDLRSDTLTKPTIEMRQAMANAVVGDDVCGEDPTINTLESRCAKLFNKEAALFVPSGTMGNLLALMVHCSRRGVEAIVGHLTHVYLFEQGNAASLAGIHLTAIENKLDGTFCLDEFKKKIRGTDVHEPVTKLAVVENTHNMCSGTVIPLDFLDALCVLCKENDMKTHMDGARVFNAAEYLGVSVARITRDFDSVCFCLSKGLSAPVGSVLVGSQQFIYEARRLRKALGGGMRQAGVLAAAGLVAIDTIIPILKYDHQRARKIAEAISKCNSVHVRIDLKCIQTNIVIIEMVDERNYQTEDFRKRLMEVSHDELNNGIRDENGLGISIKISSRDSKFARIVIYHEITDKDTELIIKKIIYCIKELESI